MSDKKTRTAEAVRDINKRHGDRAIGYLEGPTDEVLATSTGSPGLDLATGIGGYPVGRVVEILGPVGAGKSSLGLAAVCEAQRAGKVAAWVDADHDLDLGHARDAGVSFRDLLVSQPDTGEQALDVVETLLRSGAVDLVVVDSVGGLAPKAEIEGDAEASAGLQARLLSAALRKITALCPRACATVVFLNDLRTCASGLGPQETCAGGAALKYYSSMRLEVRRLGPVEVGGTYKRTVGHRARVKVLKNKVAAPFREAEVEIRHGRGLHASAEIVDLAAELGIVDRSAGSYGYQGERLGVDRERAIECVASSPALTQALGAAIRAAHEEV